MTSTIRRNLSIHTIWTALVFISGCTAPQTDDSNSPPFGQTVRAALLAQEVPLRKPSKPAYATFMELQQSLETQQTTKPVTNNTSRSSMNNSTRNLGQ